MKETQLVAFYVSKLNRSSQVRLYAKYLQDVVDDEERKISLKYAEDSGLEVLSITKQVMENIRSTPHEMDSCANLQVELYCNKTFFQLFSDIFYKFLNNCHL